MAETVSECRKQVDQLFRTVRDLSLGLRPSMLDDFGLQPALEWHVRDVTRRYGIDVELNVEGDFDTLPDRCGTCIYRVVQEALTNAVRHARARSIKVNVVGDVNRLTISIEDDGIGLDPARRRDGLGLRGIEERVKELHGNMIIRGYPAAGTTLTVNLPRPLPAVEKPLARVAG